MWSTLESETNNNVQPALSKCFEIRTLSDQEVLNQDLCCGLLASNMALSKLNNKFFLSFITKYCKISIPANDIFETNYCRVLVHIYINVRTKIRAEVVSNCFFISVDKTTDSAGQHIAHSCCAFFTEVLFNLF